MMPLRQTKLRARAFLACLTMSMASAAYSAPAFAADPPRGQAPAHGPAWLGVQMADGNSGVLVRRVLHGSPAERAGVHDGDVLVTVDRVRVVRAQDVSGAVSLRSPGDVVTLGVQRGDRAMDLNATLDARPAQTDQILARNLVGSAAPAWVHVAPLAGAPASMDALRGRVVVVDFWASFCGPCRYMTPELSAIDARYHAQGLTVVGITTDNAEVAASTRDRWGMRYGAVVDTNGETSESYGITALPTMFVVDRKGVVRYVSVGASQDEVTKIDTVVRALLAEP